MAARKNRLRLLKVIVQPVFVVDDGELTEKTVQPVTVPAKEWPEYPAKMAEEMKEAEKELGEGA